MASFLSQGLSSLCSTGLRATGTHSPLTHRQESALNGIGKLVSMSAVQQPGVHRWTRAEYDARVAAGFFDNTPVELLDGELIDVPPASNRHFHTVTLLHNLVNRVIDPDEFLVASQGPFALDDSSEPEPDVFVMRRHAELLLRDHARPADIVLVVEVSLSSWAYDSGDKLRAYARGSIAEVWLVDLNRDIVHVCRKPIDGMYTERFTVDRDGSVELPETGIIIRVADFLR